MNRKMIICMPLQIVKAEALLMLIPTLVAAVLKEPCIWSFLITIGGALLLTIPVTHFLKPDSGVIYAKEGFVIVALSWVLISAVGAVPFVLSGNIPNYADALFETVSGFTTTGSSILNNVEALETGIQFWRCFTHWLGGMGILVFVMAIANTSDRPIHIMRAEMPGPIVGKLVPKAKDTAKILYVIYFAMTVLMVLFLLAGKMPFLEALMHAFGTAGTGGFGVHPDSVAGYSPYIQWVITVFMVLFGVNFNLYYLILIKRFREALTSRELWVYLGVILTAVGIITANIYHLFGSFSEALRKGAFQVASIVTTTGFTTADFDAWPQLSRGILFILMFCGACAGSTAGGLKISRIMILFKSVKRELRKLLHPRTVECIRLEGKKVDETTVANTSSYFTLYFICIIAVFFLLSFEDFGIETNLSAAVTCFNNVGPGFAAVGPTLSFSEYSVFSKLVLSAAMLMGRLEIFPVFLAFAPTTWTKK